MLKRIPTVQLRCGMYLQELCGSWMEHPFWRSSFLIKDQADITRIIECGIQEVWIDTTKGMDVPGVDAVDVATRDAEVDRELERVTAPPILPRTTVLEELAHARRICSRSREAVVSMFSEVRMGQAISAEAALPLVIEISESVERNPGALISLARLKTADDYTYMHSVAVCALMLALARQLGLPEVEMRKIGLAGLMHDLGKAMMPPEVLNKPGKLTDREFEIIKSHPLEGHHLLVEGRGADEVTLDVCLHHHEKTDGSGYPDRLTGDAISLHARMGAVCDVYDAITSNRPYKAGWDPAESVRKMAEWSKGHFDETVFQAFVRSVGIYPVGSLVRLDSGRIGIVTEQGEKSLLTPRVRVFYSTRSNAYIKPERVDLARSGCQDRIHNAENPSNWHFKDLHLMWQSET